MAVELTEVNASTPFSNLALQAWQEFENIGNAINWPSRCEFFRPNGVEIGIHERDMSLSQLKVSSSSSPPSLGLRGK